MNSEELTTKFGKGVKLFNPSALGQVPGVEGFYPWNSAIEVKEKLVHNSHQAWRISTGIENIVDPAIGARDSANVKGLCQFGNGGTEDFFYFDANDADFSVSSTYARVSVAFQTPAQVSGTAPISDVRVPDPTNFRPIVCNVQAKSSNQTKPAKLTFSQTLVGSSTIAETFIVAVPRKAKSFLVLPAYEVTSASVPITTVEISRAPGIRVETIGATVLESLARTHCFRELPPYASSMRVTLIAGVVATVIFNLEL